MGMQSDQRVFNIGDVLRPGDFPLIEDAYRITRRAAADAPQAWFVLFIDPAHRQCDKVDRFVRRYGFMSYWPRAKTLKRVLIRKNGLKENAKRRASHLVEAVTPLLPRYILVRMPKADTPFGTLTSDEAKFNGIQGFICTMDGPTTIRDTDVTDLMRREDEGEFDQTVKRGRKVVMKQDWSEPGRRVRVADGPFASFYAVVEKHVGTDRLQVMVDLFGRSTLVDLTIDQLQGA